MVYTHNLVQGVAVGVLLSFFFARRVSQLVAVRSELCRTARSAPTKFTGRSSCLCGSLHRQLRFQGSDRACGHRCRDAHLLGSHISRRADKVILKFRREGTRVDVVGMNEASSTLVNRLTIHDKPEALEIMTDH
ncbi:MAG: hypothetical protein R2856_03660 [Caldilineaceae bacterium]